MTCIVGLKAEGKVWVGGDSAGTSRGGSQHIRSDTKVFKKGEFAFGFCGSYRLGQLLRARVTPPTPRENTDPHEYLVTEFIDKVRQVMKSGGNAHVENGMESLHGSFVIGWRGELYEVHGDLQVALTADDYTATGSGWELALGSLATTERLRMGPRARVTGALNAAAKFDAFVEPPFTVVRV